MTNTQRVSPLPAVDVTVRVPTTGGQPATSSSFGGDPWGGTWGNTWGMTWRLVSTGQPAIPESPAIDVTARVSEAADADNTQRVGTAATIDNTVRVSSQPTVNVTKRLQ